MKNNRDGVGVLTIRVEPIPVLSYPISHLTVEEVGLIRGFQLSTVYHQGWYAVPRFTDGVR